MTKMIFIDLAGMREVREVSEAIFIPKAPAIIMLDSRPWVRRVSGGVAWNPEVYQEVSFSSLDPLTKVHPRQEDCEIAEQENRNLRAILADVSHAAPSLWDLIAERLAMPVDAGGVVEDGGEDDREVLRELLTAAGKLADVAEAVADGTAKEGEAGAAFLAEQCRTVRSKITEVEEALLPTLHEARRKA